MGILKQKDIEEEQLIKKFYEMISYHIRQMQQCLITAGQMFYDKNEEKKIQEDFFMDNIYSGMAVGVFELDNLVACFVALDAASKAANVKIQSVERNRLKSGAGVKMRGSVSDVNAAMEVALEAARPLGKVVSHTVIASPSEDTEIALKMTINK